MEVAKRWWLRVVTGVAAAVTVWLVPAYAWAAEHPGVTAAGAELARGYRIRRRGSPFGSLFGGCCCLLVLLVVLGVVLVTRRRRGRRMPPGQYPPGQYPPGQYPPGQ